MGMSEASFEVERLVVASARFQLFVGMRTNISLPPSALTTHVELTKTEILGLIQRFLAEHQQTISSYNVTEVDFIRHDYHEFGWRIETVNYPTRPQVIAKLSVEIEELGRYMLKHAGQERVCIVKPTNTILLRRKPEESP